MGELSKLGLAYLHAMQGSDEDLLHDIRRLWSHPLIVNRPNRPRAEIGADIATGLADLESYGQFVLANPDLTERLRLDAPLNEADHGTFFGGGARGYTDYPAMQPAVSLN